MCLVSVIFALSFLTTSAHPLHRNTREAIWNDSKNSELSKDVDQIYKTHIDSSGLYNPDNQSKNPVAEEMQRKLIMESERLRNRLQQELAELRERLSPSPAPLSSALASMRERLGPFTQQLQSSLSSNTRDLCGQLSLYLQGLETAEAQSEATPALYQEAFHWMSQTLEQSSSEVANLISDFHTKTIGVVEHLKAINAKEQDVAISEHWQEISSRLGQEVSSLRVEAQNRVGAVKAELTALLETPRPSKAEVTASLERFCQNAVLQSQLFQARMDRLFEGLEEELEVQGASSLSPSSSSTSLQPGSYLQEDFSVKLSALIQDILHSV
ncbi:apolipoprotein A-IV [Etheostoma cragini]|uniref:apolipoprotein A-IV n=1 Tax=Etheostoma cragini TaxID=417921 RepID=UPI00155E54CA|nr:apolipoprotein A-IV [Etheostoma cragini]XP_034723211.1 apolipoprotein A-IV [Etheostoma cragini]